MTWKKKTFLCRPLLPTLLVGVLACVAFVQFSYYFIYLPLTCHGVDFTVLWRAARQFVSGEPVYERPLVLIGSDGWEVFKYPLMLAMITGWLGQCEPEIAQQIWKFLMLGCVIVVGWGSVVAVRGVNSTSGRNTTSWAQRWLPSITVFLALSSFSPLSWSLSLGQVGPLITLCLVLAWLGLRRAHIQLSTVCVAAAGLIKISPLLLLGAYVVKCRWNAIIWTVGLVLFYGLIVLSFGRLSDEIYYLTRVAPEIPYLTHDVSYSLFQGLLRLVGVDPHTERRTFHLFLIVYEVVGLTCYLGILVLLAHRRCCLLELWTSCLIGLTVISPVLEGHHYVVLWPAFVQDYTDFLQKRLPVPLAVALIFAWLPIFLSGPLNALSQNEQLKFLPAVAACVLWGLTILRFSLSNSSNQPGEP